MYNDYIISVASRLFVERMRDTFDIKTLDNVAVQQTADICIALARIFYERVQATLPREKPFELLDDIENDTDR